MLMYVHAKSVESVAALMTLVVAISLVCTTNVLGIIIILPVVFLFYR